MICKQLRAALIFAAFFIFTGCQKDSGPQELLDRYFGSAIRQDYATTYSCYYRPYCEKISKEEFIKRRKEASILQSYSIHSIDISGNRATCEIDLTFPPFDKLQRKDPVKVQVTEELVKEDGAWKIKVW